MEKQTTKLHSNEDSAPISIFYIIKACLKNDIVAGIFIFGFISILLAVEILSFQFGTLTAKFYEIIPHRSGPEFTTMIARFSTFIVMMALGKASLMGTRALLARSMRRNLTQYFHSKYLRFSGLKLNVTEPRNTEPLIDAPDQRITEDVDKFSKGVLNILEIVFMSPILIIFYTVQVYSKLSLVSVVSIYTHFLLSFLVLRLGMRRLKELTVKLEQREALFRAEHLNIKVNSESFLLINSQNLLDKVKLNLNHQLTLLLFTTKQLIITESAMEMGKNFFSYSGALLNFLLLTGELTWGQWRSERDPAKIANLISLTSFLSLYLIFQLSKLTSVIDSLGILNGQVERLSQFLKQLELENNEDNTGSIDFDTLEIVVKDSNNSALSVRLNENLLISGPNGSGKTTILRHLTGIWTPALGQLVIKQNGHTLSSANVIRNFTGMSVNQRPLLMACPQSFVVFTGSLYDLLGLNTVKSDGTVDEESIIDDTNEKRVQEALKISGLPVSLEPFDLVRSLTTWQSILTPGQHQRLSLTRALIHRPHLLALDETCLAMGEEEAEVILGEMERMGITVIYVDPTCNKRLDAFFAHKHEITVADMM